ncbi:MAG: TrkA family potassium uptake protein [Fimbriimonadaceae bacterium]|nr:TrkA family potassium uptake protein [Fimbriimonadaceae bacterium]
MRLVILGCGRAGSSLALQMAARGHNVTIIERNPDVLRRLGSHTHVNVVLGNGLDLDVLEQAGAAEADAFFALTRGDNTNLMAAQIVQRNFGVKKVALKAADPLRADAFRRLGLFVINASAIIAGMCRDWVLDEPIRPTGEYNILVEEMEL